MECLKMITVRHKGVSHTVPCGKCAFCLSNKRSSWMFRIWHEMRTQEYPGYFLTLTYDEKHVKRVTDGSLSLRFKDVQLYLKRIRKGKFYAKYICVGEYGGQTRRPHYHMLLWSDCSPAELQALWKSSKDNTPLGAVHFGSLSMQSAMYTLKYIIQPKQKSIDGIEKTRAQFSKGLGLNYLTNAVYEYHTMDYDDPVLFSVIDGRKVSLPRYYRSKIFTKYQLGEVRWHLHFKRRKAKRKEVRALRDLGIRKPLLYLQQLRAEQARRIISNTKHNQIL